MNKGLLVVVSAPSGCGKDTVIAKVLDKMKNDAYLSVSMTTRQMREGEADGVNYYFVSVEEFQENIRKGEMLEYTCYGETSLEEMLAVDDYIMKEKLLTQ